MSVFDRLGERRQGYRGVATETRHAKRQTKRSGTSKGYGCNSCQQQGYASFNRGLPDDYVCKICGVPGHWIDDCPQKVRGAASVQHETEEEAELRENTTTITDGSDTVVQLYDTEVRERSA